MIHIHFHDAWVEADHPRATQGAKAGQFTAKGGVEGFVSPNEGNIDFPTALKALGSRQQAEFRKMEREIDTLVGIDSDIDSALGAWKTGAEHSTINHMRNVSIEKATLSLAMKSLAANQLQFLRFVPGDKPEYMLSFQAKGTPTEIHNELLDKGVEFHTLELKDDGATVHVYGSDQDTYDKVADVADNHGSPVKVMHGMGKFIGTHKQTGTEEEQRADARRVYEKIIARAFAAGKLRGSDRAKWDDIRHRWRRQATEGTADRRGIRIGDRLIFHWVTDSSHSVRARRYHSRGV